MNEKQLRRAIVAVALLWDTGWKAVAIRRAVIRREFRWIAPLAFVNSLGVLPIFYVRTRPRPRD